MSYTIEIARIDHSKDGIKAHQEDRIELVKLENGSTGVFRTWWGEKIGVDMDSGMEKVDLTNARSLRSAITGKKGDRRFIRRLGTAHLQLNKEWLLLVKRDNER